MVSLLLYLHLRSPQVFLLYLNDKTYLKEDPETGQPLPGEALCDELRAARAADCNIIMLHENDMAKGGCEFGARSHPIGPTGPRTCDDAAPSN